MSEVAEHIYDLAEHGEEQMVLSFGRTVKVECWHTTCPWETTTDEYDAPARAEQHRVLFHPWVRAQRCCHINGGVC